MLLLKGPRLFFFALHKILLNICHGLIPVYLLLSRKYGGMLGDMKEGTFPLGIRSLTTVPQLHRSKIKT